MPDHTGDAQAVFACHGGQLGKIRAGLPDFHRRIAHRRDAGQEVVHRNREGFHHRETDGLV
jgi:hypothetical protein